MASRLFQSLYKGLVKPLVTPKTKFSTSSVTSTPSGSSKSGPPDNKNTMTILKIVGGFLPGVYMGHLMTDQGVIDIDEDKNGKQEKEKDSKDDTTASKDNVLKPKDSKDKGSNEKDSKDGIPKDKDKAVSKGDSLKDIFTDSKDTNKEAIDKKSEDKHLENEGKEAKDDEGVWNSALDKIGSAKDAIFGSSGSNDDKDAEDKDSKVKDNASNDKEAKVKKSEDKNQENEPTEGNLYVWNSALDQLEAAKDAVFGASDAKDDKSAQDKDSKDKDKTSKGEDLKNTSTDPKEVKDKTEDKNQGNQAKDDTNEAIGIWDSAWGQLEAAKDAAFGTSNIKDDKNAQDVVKDKMKFVETNVTGSDESKIEEKKDVLNSVKNHMKNVGNKVNDALDAAADSKNKDKDSESNVLSGITTKIKDDGKGLNLQGDEKGLDAINDKLKSTKDKMKEVKDALVNSEEEALKGVKSKFKYVKDAVFGASDKKTDDALNTAADSNNKDKDSGSNVLSGITTKIKDGGTGLNLQGDEKGLDAIQDKLRSTKNDMKDAKDALIHKEEEALDSAKNELQFVKDKITEPWNNAGKELLEDVNGKLKSVKDKIEGVRDTLSTLGDNETVMNAKTELTSAKDKIADSWNENFGNNNEQDLTDKFKSAVAGERKNDEPKNDKENAKETTTRSSNDKNVDSVGVGEAHNSISDKIQDKVKSVKDAWTSPSELNAQIEKDVQGAVTEVKDKAKEEKKKKQESSNETTTSH